MVSPLARRTSRVRVFFTTSMRSALITTKIQTIIHPPVGLRVTCPVHRKLLAAHLGKMRDNAHRMIDPEFGRVQNNLLESGFFHVWPAGVKRRCMRANHFYMIACQGLLNSNQTAMRAIKGSDYSWRLEVYKKLRMPVTDTVLTMETKRQADRENNRLRMQQRRTDGRKGRGKHEGFHRQQQRKADARDSRGFEHLSLTHTASHEHIRSRRY